MNYLIPMFNCFILNNSLVALKANVKYKVDLLEDCGIVFGKNGEIPFGVNWKENNKNNLNVEINNNSYHFLFPTYQKDFFATKFTYNGKEVFICLSTKLNILIDSQLVCECKVENISFSHYQIEDKYCLIFFKGNRNYLVILEDKELCFANYYDECNISEEEKYFMTKLNDSLNHGMVNYFKNKKLENYLVYLDDEELHLKTIFVPFVFLDCVKATNYKYANGLLNQELKLNDAKEIQKFFPEFEFYYPATENVFILINKNTLAGIYEFEMNDNKISNIKNLQL